MKNKFIFGLILFSSIFLNAQDIKEIKKTETSVTFKIKNFGVNVDGHFETVSVATLFNSEMELTDITATVEVESITTGMESRDKHILREDFFYVEKHRNITLKTIALKKQSDKSYLLTANLEVKGISKHIEIPIQVKKSNEGFIIISNFEVNRKDFNIGGNSFVLGKTVKISVKHTH